MEFDLNGPWLVAVGWCDEAPRHYGKKVARVTVVIDWTHVPLGSMSPKFLNWNSWTQIKMIGDVQMCKGSKYIYWHRATSFQIIRYEIVVQCTVCSQEDIKYLFCKLKIAPQNLKRWREINAALCGAWRSDEQDLAVLETKDWIRRFGGQILHDWRIGQAFHLDHRVCVTHIGSVQVCIVSTSILFFRLVLWTKLTQQSSTQHKARCLVLQTRWSSHPGGSKCGNLL